MVTYSKIYRDLPTAIRTGLPCSKMVNWSRYLDRICYRQISVLESPYFDVGLTPNWNSRLL
jgi:hypothetical protein